MFLTESIYPEKSVLEGEAFDLEQSVPAHMIFLAFTGLS
jgi:hypothetical protein